MSNFCKTIAEVDEVRGDSEWLFPSSGGKPLTGWAVTKAMKRNLAVFGLTAEPTPTVHDLRRTFTTQLAAMGTAPIVLQKLLNHTPDSLVGKVYDKHDYLEPMLLALTAWGQRIEDIAAGHEPASNIVSLAAAGE